MQSRIGPYRVEGEVGRGGMGVVFRAIDERLDRVVAIKALPEEMATDPARLERFEREAKVLAQLDHPNVAHIYGVEEQQDEHGTTKRYLVLEFVEGETLGELLDHGALGIDEAMEIAGQIAAGVEAAHEAGVIHRDLKPANIKITPEGKVKVLDFGLAKAEEHSTTSSGMSQHPTMTTPAVHSPTIPGVILGTAAYMSPEQARGRRVDKRTDIWSFGVVVYEMLTGASPFYGETVSDSIGAVLHKTIELERLPSDLPRGVRRVLSRCVERDKALRYRDIGDVRLELAAARHGSVDETGHATSAGLSGLLWVALVAVCVLLGGGAWWFGKSSVPVPEMPGPLFVTAPMPENPALEDFGGFAISPTERLLASIGYRPEDDPATREAMIFVQDLDTGERKWLDGSERAEWLSFSPDGQQIGFSWFDPNSDREEFRRIPVRGGPVLTVFTDPDAVTYYMRVPVWISQEELLVIGQRTDGFFRAMVADGTVEPYPKVELTEGWSSLQFPVLLDRNTVLATVFRPTAMGQVETAILRVSLLDGSTTEVLRDASYPTVLDSGHLVFTRNQTLCVVPFDRDSVTVTGGVTPIIQDLYDGRYELSPQGDLVYLQSRGAPESRVLALDENRELHVVLDTQRDYTGIVEHSPDGSRFLVDIFPDNGPPQSTIFDLNTGAMHRIPSEGGIIVAMGWMPDGRVLCSRFKSYNLGEAGLYDPTTGAFDLVLPEPDGTGFQVNIKPVGNSEFVVMEYYPYDGEHGIGIYLVDLGEPVETRAAIPVVVGQGQASEPNVSPDGRWLAYQSEASGDGQVVLRELRTDDPTAPTRVHAISTAGGNSPRWSRDGTRLYFIAPGNDLMVVDFDPGEPGSGPTISRPGVAFRHADMPFKDIGDGTQYTLDHQDRVVFIEEPPDNTPQEMTLILNWVDSLGLD